MKAKKLKELNPPLTEDTILLFGIKESEVHQRDAKKEKEGERASDKVTMTAEPPLSSEDILGLGAAGHQENFPPVVLQESIDSDHHIIEKGNQEMICKLIQLLKYLPQ